MIIRKTIQELGDQLVGLSHCLIEDEFLPKYRDAAEGYEHFRASLDYMREKLGDYKYLKILDMLEAARVHFEEGDIKLGAWLMQDMEAIIDGDPAFAYPRHLWRWGSPLPINRYDKSAINPVNSKN
jgi:hypothetical protein